MSVDKMRKGNERRRVHGCWTAEEVADIWKRANARYEALKPYID